MWDDPAEYLRGKDIRLRYNRDLLAQVGAVRPRYVADLGCGPGNVTAMLARHWPAAHVLGIDTSPAMLEQAAPLARPRRWFRRGSLEFRHCDLRQWEPGHLVDVILAGAVLQWIPGHGELLPRLGGFLAPGGVLGFQMPVEFGQADRIVFELCASGDWRVKLADVPGLRPVDDPVDYLTIMAGAGLHADTWQTTYTVVLDCGNGRNGVVEHIKATVLAPVLARLSDTEAPRFLTELAARVRSVYPPTPLAGQLVQIVPERRVFGIARKPA